MRPAWHRDKGFARELAIHENLKGLKNMLSAIKHFFVSSRIGPLARKLFASKAETLSHGGAAAVSEPPETLAFRAASTVRALERIASRGIEIECVIDVGASNGMWTAATMPVFPGARYLLVEAQKGHLDALQHFVKQHSNAEYVLAAAGDEESTVFFDDGNLFGVVASKEQTVAAKIRVPMITLDAEVKRRGLKGAYLVKLDTHGFEVPILKGAVETLKMTNLVVIETYNFRIAPGSLLFHEMCGFMEKHGFGVIDISEPLWRTHDRSFWQIDLFFVRLDRPEFSYLAYA